MNQIPEILITILTKYGIIPSHFVSNFVYLFFKVNFLVFAKVWSFYNLSFYMFENLSNCLTALAVFVYIFIE